MFRYSFDTASTRGLRHRSSTSRRCHRSGGNVLGHGLSDELRVSGNAHFGDVQTCQLDFGADAVSDHLADDPEDGSTDSHVPGNANARFDDLGNELARVA